MDIVIPLDSSDQTVIDDWLATLHPDVDPAARVTLLAARARNLLRDDLVARLADKRAADQIEAENAQRRADLEAFPPAPEAEPAEEETP